MSRACPPEHEHWMVEALAAGAAALSASARAELERCPHCAAEWAELEALRVALARAAEGERDTLARAAREAGADEERVVRRALAAELAPRARKLRRLAPWLVLAAAAAALLFILPRIFAPGEKPSEVLLGAQRIAIASPSTGGGFGSFAWTDAKPDGNGYHVAIRSPRGEVLFQGNVDASPLALPKEETDTWPARIFLTVSALDRGHQPLALGAASLALSR